MISETKVIVIFGGAGLLGRKLCKRFYSQKTKVISVDINHKKTERIKNSKKNLFKINADVLNKSSMKKLKTEILSCFKKVDSVIFLATYKSKDFYVRFTSSSLEGWKKTLEVELDGAYIVSQIFGPIMEKRRAGNFVFLSSIYGLVGNDHSIYKGSNLAGIYTENKKQKNQIFSSPAYSVAKGGIISLTKYLAAYWGNRNIRVNCVSPGGIYNKSENKIFLRNYSKKVPMKRKARVEEVCDSIIFLSSEESSYINGHNLIVDGGFTAW